MTVKSRLEIYASKDVKDRAVIIGERMALKELGRVLIAAADSPAGFEITNLYKGTGHDYEIFVTKNISEDEWQAVPSNPNKLAFISDYEDLRKELDKEKL